MPKKDFIFDELDDLIKKIDTTDGLPEELAERLRRMVSRLDRMAKLGHYASEFDILSRYIETVTDIPWNKRTQDNLDLENARKVLESNHYGMNWVKDRVLEHLATLILVQRRKDELKKIETTTESFSQSPILLLVGLQGIGKTTLAASIAETLDRKFVRIALGGIGSALELRGKSKAYPEAEPGQIIKALIRSEVRNPLILLDEIDKASGEKGLREDIMAILLEILDPNQNNEFRDHYIDFPVDLSEVLFICSANTTGTISTALMDRMEVIKMPSYTDAEKLVIARDYILPKILVKNGLKPEEFEIDPNLWPGIVRPFGFDSGIRSLARTLEAVTRKAALEIVEGKAQKVAINESNLKHYLPK